MESRILIESTSPLCKIQAYAEENDTCVYFYLWEEQGAEPPLIRACWVRNYSQAPSSLRVAAMREGEAPMLPADCCSHPDGAERLDPNQLSVVWFEEGVGAALLSGDEILCVIPEWADTGKCPGYARDCIKPSPLAWPLGSPDENILFQRIRKAKEFWEGWNETSWPSIQTRLVDAVAARLGPPTKYYAIDGGHWPPKALLRIERQDTTCLVTVGVSIPSQPAVEQCSETPEQLRRFELAMAIRTDLFIQNERGILSYVSAQTTLPWAHRTWLGDGHTIPCDQIPGGLHRFPFVLLLRSPVGAPAIDLGSYRGDRINLLWMVPITSEEKAFAEAHGTSELLGRTTETQPWVHDGTPKFSPKKGLLQRLRKMPPWRS